MENFDESATEKLENIISICMWYRNNNWRINAHNLCVGVIKQIFIVTLDKFNIKN